MEIEGISLLVLSSVLTVYVAILLVFKTLPLQPCLDTKIFTDRPSKRVPFFDFAKGIAITAVILIHVAFLLAYFSDDLPLSFLSWNEGINRAMRFAIPVFFISSGALLFLQNFKIETLKGFYLPKIKRLVIPYVAFSFFATFATSKGSFILFDYITAALKDLLTGGALVPYWFIPVLFQLYLLYPLLWYLLVVKRINPLTMLAGSFAFSLSSYFLFSPYWLGWQEYLGDLTFFGAYLFFFVLGMVLKPFFFAKTEEITLWLERTKFLYFGATIIFLYFFIGMADPLSHFYNVRLIYGPVVMIIIFYLYPFLRGGIRTLIEGIGRQSLPIYLLHFILLTLLIPLVQILILYDTEPGLIFVIVFIVNFFMTYGFISIARKMFEATKIATSNKNQRPL